MYAGDEVCVCARLIIGYGECNCAIKFKSNEDTYGTSVLFDYRDFFRFLNWMNIEHAQTSDYAQHASSAFSKIHSEWTSLVVN